MEKGKFVGNDLQRQFEQEYNESNWMDYEFVSFFNYNYVKWLERKIEASKTSPNLDYAKCHICKGNGKVNVGSNEEPDSITCPECNGRGHFA